MWIRIAYPKAACVVAVLTMLPMLSRVAAQTDAPRVTRADLAWVLLDFESALAARELDEMTIRRVNRQFDIAVSYFFTNRHSAAVELISRVTRELSHEANVDPVHEWLRSLAVQIEPRAFVVGEASEATVIIRPLYSAPHIPQDWGEFELRLIDDSEDVVWNATIDLADDLDGSPINARLALAASFADLATGAYRIELAHPNGSSARYRTLFVLPRPVDVIRRELLARLNSVNDADLTLERAIRIARARVSLLKQHPSQLNATEILADLHALNMAVSDEVAALERSRDPYIMREGDLWRPAATRSVTWPVRVYSPTNLNHEEPLPLIIALHGAGGDENMFHDAYGNGFIRRLADTHRFIVASPLTYPLAGDMSLLSELIDEMQRCYPIDEDRVYLIGHSLGAGTVAAALLAMPERIAAASCIAGAGRFASGDDEQPYPPVLVIGAEHDYVIPTARVQRQAEAGIERGLPIEYRLAEHWGHVLIVGGVLEEVISWLLKHRREAAD
jgi:predicted esterase